MKRNIFFWIILAILGFDILIILPWQLISFFRYSGKVNTKLKKVVLVKQEIARSYKLKEDIKKEKERFKRIVESSVDNEEIPSVMSKISEIAKNYIVKIREIRPQEASIIGEIKNGDYSLLPLRCVGEAGFHNFLYFINKLENYKKLIRIRSLEISGSSQKYNHPIIVNLELFILNVEDRD